MVERSTPTFTFLFSDIEGSTKLWEQYPEWMNVAVAKHDVVLRKAVEDNGGRVWKAVGDGFFSAFPSASEALAAALAGQRAIQRLTWGDVAAIRVRMAIHTGPVEERDGDYFGPTLNRLSRLLAAGNGGQILISQIFYELLDDALPDGVTVRDLGERRLKDLVRPERIYQLVASDLPSEFPSIRTLDSRPNNLPSPTTSLVGREADVATLLQDLRRPNYRIMTLIGPGGMGKTRLSIQVGAEMIDDFEDGVFFVPLASVTDPALVAPAIGQVLGLRDEGSQSVLHFLIEALRGKQLLLILDNFEQVVAGSTVLAELVRTCPALKFLVSSRIKLDLLGERVYEVPPLSVPSLQSFRTLDQLNEYAAVRLFVERAHDARAAFVLTDENAAAVAEICARVDGWPLALELAAAKIRILTPDKMLKRLDKRLPLLTSATRDRREGQKTLRNAITWSYEQLEPADQGLFRFLSIFVNGFPLEAAEAVVAEMGSANPDYLNLDVLAGLESLIDNSLIRREESPRGDLRLRMLETIHEFGIEELTRLNELEDLGRQHAAYYLALAEEAEPQIRGANQALWLDRLQVEHDNFRAALDWATAHDGVDTGLRLGAARRYAEESLTLFRQTGDKRSQASALNNLGELHIEQNEYATARRLFVESVKLRQELGERLGLIELLEDFAMLSAAQNQTARAVQLAGAVSALRHTLGFPPYAAGGLRLERKLGPTREQLSPEVWQRSWSEGETMTIEDAIAYALRDEPAQLVR